MVSRDPNSQNHATALTVQANAQTLPLSKPPSQKVCELADGSLGSEDEVRGGPQNQFTLAGSLFGLHAVRTDQRSYSQCGAREGLGSHWELGQGWTDDVKIIAILPRTRWGQPVGPHRASNPGQLCLSSDEICMLELHSLWPTVQWSQRRSCLGRCLRWWDWMFCAFVQRLQTVGKQHEVCSPYQTFSFLLLILPPKQRLSFNTGFVCKCH